MAIRENFLHEFGGMVQFGGTTSEQSTKGFSTNLRKPAKVLHYTVQYTYSVNIAYPGNLVEFCRLHWYVCELHALSLPLKAQRAYW